MNRPSQEPIRVLRIVARMNIGGPALQISGLMEGFSKDEVHQRLIFGTCEKDENELPGVDRTGWDCIEIKSLGRRIKFFSDFLSFYIIANHIRKFKPHVVHTHTAKAGILGRFAAIFIPGNRIIIHTYHGHILHGYFGKLATSLIKKVERYLAKKSDILICVGERVKRDLLLEGIGHPHQYRVFHPGIPIPQFTLAESLVNPIAIQTDSYTVSWIGRLVPIKAPFRIIEIAKEIVQRNLPVQILVVGDGPLLPEISEQAEALALPIVFLGWRNDIGAILSNSDLVFMTSINEGMPTTLLQAAMFNIPFVASAVGSIPELTARYALGKSIRYNTCEFVDVMMSLLTTGSQLQSRYALNEEIVNEFSSENLALKHLRLYNEEIKRVLPSR